MKFSCLFGVTTAIGTIIGWTTIGPTWESAQSLVGLIIVWTLLVGAFIPRKCIPWTLTLIGGTALLNIVLNGNYMSLVSIPVGAIGTTLGFLVRRTLVAA